jgi:hypothetical protein
LLRGADRAALAISLSAAAYQAFLRVPGAAAALAVRLLFISDLSGARTSRRQVSLLIDGTAAGRTR